MELTSLEFYILMKMVEQEARNDGLSFQHCVYEKEFADGVWYVHLSEDTENWHTYAYFHDDIVERARKAIIPRLIRLPIRAREHGGG